MSDNVTTPYESAKAPGPLDRILASKPRTPRCGPWVDGVCEKCGRRDPLDLIDYFEEAP